MKAIISNNYGSISNLHLSLDFPKPTTIPKKEILVKTECVALAPGDCRVLSGACKELQGPPSFPYIPGGDLCGTVLDLNGHDPTVLGYDVGDRVATRFTRNRDALAEYCRVSTVMTGKVPATLSSSEAAALASSATIALSLSNRITSDERVLVIGAGGGVGSHLLQFLKLKSVKFLAAATHDCGRMSKDPFHLDALLDYTNTDIYEFSNWQKVGVDEQFDTVVDLSGGSWLRFLEQIELPENEMVARMIVKSNSKKGRYLTLVPDVYNFEIHTVWQGMKLFLFQNLSRAFYSRFFKRNHLPAHTFAMSLDNDLDVMKETLNLASEKKIYACVDDRGPFGFSTEGVQAAFELQKSRKVKGKVIVQVSDQTNVNPQSLQTI